MSTLLRLIDGLIEAMIGSEQLRAELKQKDADLLTARTCIARLHSELKEAREEIEQFKARKSNV